MKTKSIKEKTLLRKLGKFVSVENVESRNGCGKAPNQFRIVYEKGEIFQSYKSLIGVYFDGTYYFNNLHSCSNTTSSHTTRWCGYDAKERRKGLADGTFIKIVD